ncbi:SPRY domain-containing SOCS box protein / gustavus-like protein [Euroglyphus maynei]|uniref:SPRY domain-containing SOCS box protein / gustavus-like protein n=1 Tax=Euroglyphus maynei TaxID=6958 RepID=A0A1Y3BAK0_EURMA|nr:SPRY domain-containing SOCS box protein / gustavus-like protein [Euroglyphus maynei]
MGQKFSNFMGSGGTNNGNGNAAIINSSILNSHTAAIAAATMPPIVNDFGSSIVNNSNNLNKTVMRDHHHQQLSSPFHNNTSHNHFHHQDIQKQNGWNENDRSLNIIVVEQDPRIVHRHPVAQSTDCVRGLMGYNKGLHVWEIKWPLRQRGTHAVVGVATADAALHSNGYHPLVGATADSWGWDLGRNLLYHDLKSQNYGRNSPRDNNNNNYGRIYQHQFAHDPQFVAPESFLIVLDMDKGTLAFMAHGQYLGVAFNDDGIKGKTLYPIISSVWGHCEITLRYINGLNPTAKNFSKIFSIWLTNIFQFFLQ